MGWRVWATDPRALSLPAAWSEPIPYPHSPYLQRGGREGSQGGHQRWYGSGASSRDLGINDDGAGLRAAHDADLI